MLTLLLTTNLVLLWALIGVCIDRMFQEGINRPWSHWRYILSGPLLAGPLWHLYVLTVIEDLEQTDGNVNPTIIGWDTGHTASSVVWAYQYDDSPIKPNQRRADHDLSYPNPHGRGAADAVPQHKP